MPKPELFIARIRFALFCRAGQDSLHSRIEEEQEKILQLINPLDEARAFTPILIKRLRGLEDSSRFWSPLMVVDHLRITNLAMANAIRSLCKGVVPGEEVSTAEVKPDPACGPEVLAAFKRSCEFAQKAATHSGLHTTETYAHPWFGEINAHQWYSLVAMHMGLHRKQIERILAS